MNAYILNLIDYKSFFKKKIAYKEIYAVEKSSNGVRFKNNVSEPTIVIYSYLFRNHTVEEIMSVLLHEIGHAFFYMEKIFGLFRIYSFLATILFSLKDISDLITKEPDPRKPSAVVIIKSLNKIIESSLMLISPKAAAAYRKLYTTNMYVFVSYYSKLGGIFAKALAPLINALNLVNILNPNVIIGSVGKNIINVAANFLLKSYDNEKYADNFSTTYGYGVGVAKTFSGSLSELEKGTMESEVAIALYTTSSIANTILNIADPHPDNYKRVKLTRDKLRFELKNKNLNTELKKEIEGQLVIIDKLLSSNSDQVAINKQINLFVEDMKESLLADKSDKEIFNL